MIARIAMLALALALTACKSTDRGSPVKDVPTADRPANYVGCRPSPGECMNSCATRNGIARLNAELCEPDSIEPYACFCGDDRPPEQPEPPEETHFFVGCRYSAGECFNSCATRQGIALESPSRCGADRGEGALACFCER